MPEDYIAMLPLSVYRAACQIPFQYLVSNGGSGGTEWSDRSGSVGRARFEHSEQRNFYFENMYLPARVNKYR